MDDPNAMATAPQLSQQNCPLMKLPTELRIIIYNLALQHILEAIYDEVPTNRRLSQPLTKPRGHRDGGVLFYEGALALTHTSRTIRAESLDALATHMVAHAGRFMAEAQRIAVSALVRLHSMRRGNVKALRALLDELDEEKKEFNKLANSALHVGYICYTMAWTKGGE